MTDITPVLITLRDAARRQLTEVILPYWINRMTDPKGGYLGRRDPFDNPDPEAPKGAILNARILWSFSAAYRVIGRQEYLEAATRAFDYLKSHFIDTEFGGVYWSLDADGRPLDTKKQFYAIGFAIYGLSEYARATGSDEARRLAIELYEVIEKHSRDLDHGGYFEALARDWSALDDVRLSDKEENVAKTMNTHLHILEPYTNLYRVAPSEALRESIVSLIRVFLDNILDHSTGHLGLFFDADWTRRDNAISYGHDIEASWLILEAAEAIDEPALLEKVKAKCRVIADVALEGRLDNGAMVYERYDDGTLDTELHWWVQAEDVVGLYWLFTRHNVIPALQKALNSMNWIENNIVDKTNGEWHWSILSDGSVNRKDDKAGFWKCPYHNARMCLEILQ